MFNSISGIITAKLPQRLCIQTQGIEWDITVPSTTLDALPKVGMEARVFTYLQHTDALMLLYGFSSEEDRELFFNLLKVEGIGPKGAVKIMSNITTENLVSLLESGDVEPLQKVPGIGKKTAAKMLLQLKGKLLLKDEPSSTPAAREGGQYADVVLALADMGYDKKAALSAVEAVAKRLSSDKDFVSLSSSKKEDTVFRQSIVELAQ